VIARCADEACKTPSQSLLELYRLDCAYAAVGDDKTAFDGSRSSRIGVFRIALTADSDALPAGRVWVRSFWDALHPRATGAGGYINPITEQDDDRCGASYRPAEYDPDNVSRHNAHIKPALQPI
jgi:hypothetical protein